MSAKITQMVLPEYPKDLQRTRVAGTVVLNAVVAQDGSVKELAPVAGPSPLVALATEAVRQWRYDPTIVEGAPVEVSTTISVVFTPGEMPRYLQQGAAAPRTASSVDPKLKADILHLIDVTHVKETQAEFSRQMMETLRPIIVEALPPTSNQEKIVKEMSERLAATLQSQDAMERLAVIYAKYLSDEDVQGISTFYETPAGQRLNAVSVPMEDDLSQAGREYALENLPAILKALCKNYPELQGTADFCPKDKSEKRSLLVPPGPKRMGSRRTGTRDD